jgi:hypothetical protein
VPQDLFAQAVWALLARAIRAYCQTVPVPADTTATWVCRRIALLAAISVVPAAVVALIATHALASV